MNTPTEAVKMQCSTCKAEFDVPAFTEGAHGNPDAAFTRTFNAAFAAHRAVSPECRTPSLKS